MPESQDSMMKMSCTLHMLLSLKKKKKIKKGEKTSMKKKVKQIV